MLNKTKEKINSLRLNFASWKRKRRMAKQIDPREVAHLTKTVECPHQWYGNSYGGFYINPSLLNSNSIVYSFGIGKDISFDRKCIKKHKCKVYAFDPTPKSVNFIKQQRLPNGFFFYDYGITESESGVVDFYLPKNPKAVSGSLVKTTLVNSHDSIKVMMKSFDDITNDLKHKHIDVVKMDIKGSEYLVLDKILDMNLTIDQFLVGIHDQLLKEGKSKSKKLVEKMKQKGYEIFAHSMIYEEISFIHKSKL